MKNTTERSRGALLLARTALSEQDIALRIGVNRSYIGHFKRGERVPNLAKRQILFEQFGIPIESWDEAPEPEPRKAKRSKTAAPPSVPPPADSAAIIRSSVRARAAKLEGMVHQLLEDLGASATPLERARVYNSAAGTLNLLGRITGETLEIPEVRILNSPAWHRVQDALIRALAPWPAAMHAVGEELKRLSLEK